PDPYDIRSPGNFRSWSREPEPVRGGRLSQTLRYYRRFPKGSRRFLPPAPVVYTGPEGFYGGVRRALMGLGVLNLTRRMVGLRLIMTARFFVQYKSPSVPAGIFRDGSQEVLEDPGVPDPARADAALLGVTLPPTAPGDAALVSAALPNGALSGP